MFRGVGGGRSGFIVIHGTSLPWLRSRAFKKSFKVPASLGGAANSHHPGSRAHITKQTGAPVLHAGLWYLCLWRSNHKGYRKMFTLMKKILPVQPFSLQFTVKMWQALIALESGWWHFSNCWLSVHAHPLTPACRFTLKWADRLKWRSDWNQTFCAILIIGSLSEALPRVQTISLFKSKICNFFL